MLTEKRLKVFTSRRVEVHVAEAVLGTATLVAAAGVLVPVAVAVGVVEAAFEGYVGQIEMVVVIAVLPVLVAPAPALRRPVARLLPRWAVVG